MLFLGAFLACIQLYWWMSGQQYSLLKEYWFLFHFTVLLNIAVVVVVIAFMLDTYNSALGLNAFSVRMSRYLFFLICYCCFSYGCCCYLYFFIFHSFEFIINKCKMHFLDVKLVNYIMKYVVIKGKCL